MAARQSRTNTWPADKVERWPITKLIPHPRNARTHSDAPYFVRRWQEYTGGETTLEGDGRTAGVAAAGEQDCEGLILSLADQPFGPLECCRA